MKTTLRRFVGALVVGTAAFASQTASALPFSSMVVFGDSLSDTGNVFVATGGSVPTPPYFNGRFSNGPVWIDTLAAGLGLPTGAVAAFLGGNNYAFGGARTGADTNPVPGVLAQIGGLWAPTHPVADPNGLYVIAAGGNDMRDARSAYQTNSAADQAGRQSAAITAASNLLNGLGFLAAKGAKHILLANLPDLGATPEAAALGLVAASSDASARFNAQIAGLEVIAEGFGLDVHLLDLAGIALAIRNDALTNGGAIYGITNVFTPCAPFPGNIGISCNVSAFSDALHPSARTHAIFGLAALQALPEPGSVWLVLLAAVAMVARVRRSA